MKKDYGKIAVTNGGIWNEQTPYEKLTTVSRGGQAYLSFEDNQGVDPEQDCDPITGIGAKWFRIATKGDPGTTDYNELINKPTIPSSLSDLTDDATHRTVTDLEKSTWNDKTDKVSNATNGNLAGLNGNGNLTDSGTKASDFATAAQGALADTAYQKPQGGIPASDIANGVIPDVSQFITKSVNDLVNYYTKSETYTQSEVNTLIGSIQHFHYEIYASLQDITTPATNVLYLIGPSGSGNDKYEEYVYANNAFVKIGDTSIDLSNYVTIQALNTALANYVTSTDLTTLLSGKQDKIDATHKLDADLVDDSSTTHKFVTTNEKETWNGKQNTLVSGTNIKTINSNSILGNGNLDVHDVFFGTYQTTSIDDIDRAYNSNQIVILKDSVMRGTGSFVLSYVDYELSPMGTFVFVSLIQNQIYWFTLDSTNGYSDVSVMTVGTYTKPSSGIPASDIAAGVIPDVAQFITRSVDDLVNYYLKSEIYTKVEVLELIADIIALSENKEDKSNKVTSLSSNSTDVQYPSAKCVYDAIQTEIGNINSILETI